MSIKNSVSKGAGQSTGRGFSYDLGRMLTHSVGTMWTYPPNKISQINRKWKLLNQFLLTVPACKVSPPRFRGPEKALIA
jgi:hypothetical protein